MKTPPPLICKLVRAGQQARLLILYIVSKATRVLADIGFGELELASDDWRWIGDQLSADHSDSRASEARHVIFSGSHNLPPEQARLSLYLTALDWLAAHAPRRRWLMGFQQHNGTQHLHLAVANVGEDGRPLDLDPYTVIAMSRMKFTTHAISAQGKGVGRGTGKAYSKASQSLARDLAEALEPALSTGSSLEHLLLSHPGVSCPRYRRDGGVISFEFGGKRIRVSTLEGFVSQVAKGGDWHGHTPSSRPRPNRAVRRKRHRGDHVVQRLPRGR